MTESRLLAIDAGNSQIKFGLFNSDQLVHTDRIAATPSPSKSVVKDRILSFLSKEDSDTAWEGCVLSSVTPAATVDITSSVRECGIDVVLPVSADVFPSKVTYFNQHTLGADRLCDAAGGYHLARGAVIVVDFGTAITLNAVAENGDFLGGAILPGPALAAKALTSGTAQLPQIEAHFPPRAIGTDTVSCIASGLTYGWVAMVDGLVQQMEAEIGGLVSVLATGGGGAEFTKHSLRIESYHANLTLEGAAAIFRRWKERV